MRLYLIGGFVAGYIESVMFLISKYIISSHRLVCEAEQSSLSLGRSEIQSTDFLATRSNQMSRVMRNPVFGVFDMVRQKPAVQPLKMVRGLNFRIRIQEEGLQRNQRRC